MAAFVAAVPLVPKASWGWAWLVGGPPGAWPHLLAMAAARPAKGSAADPLELDTDTADPGALIEALYRRIEAPLTNVLYRWLWNRDDVREVVQDAFMRLWRMADQVDWSRAEPLVYRIALNLAANRRRRKKLLRWVSLDGEQDVSSEEGAAPDVLARQQEEQAVRRAVDSLSEKHRRVLILSSFAGLSYQQIAQALDISPGTVASRRSAAIAKVRQHMHDWEHNRDQ